MMYELLDLPDKEAEIPARSSSAAPRRGSRFTMSPSAISRRDLFCMVCRSRWSAAVWLRSWVRQAQGRPRS